ncbi:MAG: MAPEG family protein [Hyphomicrobiales bacterium]
MVVVTPIFAGLLAFLFLFLSIQVIKTRRSEKVAVGDGGNTKLQRAMRAQANFSEYTPFTLLLMAMIELLGAPAWWVFILGAILLTGRAVHAYGISQENENLKFRVFGMQCTFASLALSAVSALVFASISFF